MTPEQRQQIRDVMTPDYQKRIKDAIERVIEKSKAHAGSFCTMEEYKQNEADCLFLRCFLEVVSSLKDENERLREAAINLREAQKAYIAFARHGKLDPDYNQERERLGKIVGVKAEDLDKVLTNETKESDDE